MSSKRYTDEFKQEVIKQETERGYPAAEVARRLGVTRTACMRGCGKPGLCYIEFLSSKQF